MPERRPISEKNISKKSEKPLGPPESHIELKVFGVGVAAIAALLLCLLRGLLPVRAENVVLFALFRIAQNLVGLGDLFELLLGLFGVVGIGVGMPFARELAVRGLDVFLRSILRNAEDANSSP